VPFLAQEISPQINELRQQSGKSLPQGESKRDKPWGIALSMEKVLLARVV
jgi:hypothetical protein